MTRQIKFRAWDDHYEKMIYDDFAVRCSKSNAYSGDVLHHIGDDTYRPEHSTNRSEWILQQYTGLKDKNGKEIYEGDILRLKHSPLSDYENKAEVIWSNEDACFVAWDKENGSPEILQRHEKCEVIGNIYENPELLTTSTT